MAKNNKVLLDFLQKEFELAKTFTKKYHDSVKKQLKDYDPADMESIYSSSTIRTRYDIKIPYIFATHESILAAFFDGPFGILFRGNDDEKKQKVEAAYKYLNEKLDLDGIKNRAAWWYILTGNTSINSAFKTVLKAEPVLNPETNEQLIDPETGEGVFESVYDYNDPVVEVGEPTSLYFSPDSKFSESGEDVPYFFRTSYMSPDEVKKVYDKKVEADTTITGEGEYYSDSKSIQEKATLTKVFIYQGTIASEYKKDVPDGWDSDAIYYFVYSKAKILHRERVKEKDTQFGKMYGSPMEFFGFGVALELAPFQTEISIRRGQQMRVADLQSHPKIAVDATSDVDEDSLLDPRDQTVITFTGQPPVYLTPPDISNNIILAEQKAREDAQFTSGMMDLSTGSQQSTVKTATGQTIFAEVAERRIRKAKKDFGRFWRAFIIYLLKLGQENWDDEKVVEMDGEDVVITGADLEGIDFDRDIDVEVESTNVNKEVLRAQVIEMYSTMKDDPLINKEEIAKKVFKDGFNEKTPEKYINEQIDPMMTQDPTQAVQGTGNIPTSQEGILGSPSI